MTQKIGFIGCGNMARAIIGGIIQSGYIKPNNVIASNRSIPKLIEVKEMFNIEITQDNKVVAEQSDILFLSVTPDMYPLVINEIKDIVQDDILIITIAAGLTIAENQKLFGKNIKLLKAMPNTPVLVGEGITAISYNEWVTDQDMLIVKTLFESFGKAEFIDESVMDIASAIGGSSPAFGYVFIEAMADSAVMYGMPRQMAYTFAAQALLGAAKMVLETGKHPGQLKDEVCSPGGTTIQSISALEENGFRSSIIQAVKANIKKMNNE